MKREVNLFIEDILENIINIEEFSLNITKEKFQKNKLKQSAIIRCLEIIGEATKNIPNSFRENYPEISWKKIAGLRDIIIHAYFEIDLDITWEIITKDLPILKTQILKIKEDLVYSNKK